MPDFIHSVLMNEKVITSSRSIDSYKTINSISTNQITGDFVVTNPYNNQIVIYPQSPNNPENTLLGSTKTLNSFSGYGYLSYPMDARFDSSRGKMWIADTGNGRVLRVDSFSFLADFAIANISLPHAIIPEVNMGGVFIKGFSNLTTGVVYYYSVSGVLQFLFAYSDIVNSLSAATANVPLPSTMAYDHTRSRLWWTAGAKVYMIDVYNRQMTTLDLSLFGYASTKGMDVDVTTGNAFISCLESNGRSYVVQLFRDNNIFISSAYLPRQFV